eukprot:2651631-Ditylum_brightwellii.AAC.1
MPSCDRGWRKYEKKRRKRRAIVIARIKSKKIDWQKKAMKRNGNHSLTWMLRNLKNGTIITFEIWALHCRD